MKFPIFRLFIFFTFSVTFTSGFAQALPDSIPLRVILIRHGEKPDSGLNLSCKGYNRSLALPKVIIALFGVPDYTYVPTIRIGRTTNSVRMYQTVVPLAVKYNLLINSKYGENDSTLITNDILLKKGTVLVVWNSNDLPSIARNLGVKKTALKWKANDYDTVWIIDFIKSANNKLRPVFTIGKENIKPSSNCE